MQSKALRYTIVLLVPLMLLLINTVSADASVICQNPSGAMFVRQVCGANETHVDLSEFVPAPTIAYTVLKGATFFDSDPTTVAELDVPEAGDYVINSHVVLNNNSHLIEWVVCEIVAPRDNFSASEIGWIGFEPAGTVQDQHWSIGTISITSFANIGPGGGKISMQCHNQDPQAGQAWSQHTRITATRVSSLTSSIQPQ